MAARMTAGPVRADNFIYPLRTLLQIPSKHIPSPLNQAIIKFNTHITTESQWCVSWDRTRNLCVTVRRSPNLAIGVLKIIAKYNY